MYLCLYEIWFIFIDIIQTIHKIPKLYSWPPNKSSVNILFYPTKSFVKYIENKDIILVSFEKYPVF